MLNTKTKEVEIQVRAQSPNLAVLGLGFRARGFIGLRMYPPLDFG